MLHNYIIIASLAAKEATEIAAEMSVVGLDAVVRPEVSGEIPENCGAIVIDNSTGQMEESVKSVSQNFGITSRLFVLTGEDEPAVFEEDGILYISAKLGAKNIGGIVNFCLNPMRKIDNIIKKMLFDLGFLSHMRGHRYIMEAVKIALADHKALYNVNKNIYEAIGEKHGYNKLAIERSIRKAIETAYDRDTRSFEKFFGCLRGRPTNSHFISTFVEKLLMKL